MLQITLSRIACCTALWLCLSASATHAELDTDLTCNLTNDLLTNLANRPAPVTAIALSGGGSRGAWGAGYLTGWHQNGGGKRFDVVTGVSVGALLASFAFIGPRAPGSG